MCSSGEGAAEADEVVLAAEDVVPVGHVGQRRQGVAAQLLGCGMPCDQPGVQRRSRRGASAGAGSNRRARRAQNRRSAIRAGPACSSNSSDVTRKPDRTKNTSTPSSPPGPPQSGVERHHRQHGHAPQAVEAGDDAPVPRDGWTRRSRAAQVGSCLGTNQRSGGHTPGRLTQAAPWPRYAGRPTIQDPLEWDHDRLPSAWSVQGSGAPQAS